MLNFALISLSFVFISAQNINPSSGYTLAIDNEKSFCLIIPKNFGEDIAENDATGVAACWGNPIGAKPTKDLPKGFILSAHFVKTEHYTQVTGRYDPATYGLNPNDQGTQWDNSLKSQGGVMPWSGCAGFPQYLEFLENQRFCLRCCNHAFSDYCNPSDDEQGCKSGIPGNYGAGFTHEYTHSMPGRLVPAYLGCSPATDTCMRGNVCCVAKGDALVGNGFKTSCQYHEDCVYGTIGVEQKFPEII